jgi:hypothetical protein
MSTRKDDLPDEMIVECADCGHSFDWAERPAPCPECSCTEGFYKGRLVLLKTGHEDE